MDTKYLIVPDPVDLVRASEDQRGSLEVPVLVSIDHNQKCSDVGSAREKSFEFG